MANENLKGVKKMLDNRQLPDNFNALLSAYLTHDVSKADVAHVEDQTATGSAIKPEPAVKLGGETLTKGTHFDYTYADNTAVGTAKITVTGKGAYFFSQTVTFNIVAAPENNDDAGGGEG